MYVNVHCLNVAQRDPAYARILADADLVYCDGTGVRLGARLARRPIPERMTGADWIHDLCRRAVRDGLRLFLLAGEPGVAESAAAALRVRYPGLQIVGTLPGYGAGAGAVAEINGSSADILLVGMGTPTQEKWIVRYGDQLDAPVIWAVGALFDFVSGKLPRGPRWMTDHGLEWLCRLAAEPRKLWRRYLIGNPLFLLRIMAAYWIPRLPFGHGTETPLR
jgi:N-acetylglucosaminyldiphosphoundecaprenol N-acetyl-beta-D-mannosaminyltransferase